MEAIDRSSLIEAEAMARRAKHAAYSQYRADRTRASRDAADDATVLHAILSRMLERNL